MPRHGIPRILFVDHTAAMGGGEIALLNLVTRLDRTRFEPVVALFSDGPLVRKLRDAGVSTHVIPGDPGMLDFRKDALGTASALKLRRVAAALRLANSLARFISRERIDLVHTNSLKADVIGGIAARLSRAKLIWHVRDRIETDYLPRPAVRVFRLLCRVLPDLLIANSDSTLSTLHVSRNKGRAIHSGIDARARLHVIHDGTHRVGGGNSTDPSDGPRIVGLVGRISPWKGQHVFLQAAARVRDRFPNVRFQIVGSALFEEREYDTRVRALTVELNLQDVVEFTGFREDVPRLIAEMEILVHASTLPEPFGQVLIEGMAAGKPVVATDGGGAREIVLHSKTGYLVPMGEWQPMADAICRLLEDPESAREMGRLGRERANRHFTIQDTVRKVQAVYDLSLRKRQHCGASAHRNVNGDEGRAKRARMG